MITKVEVKRLIDGIFEQQALVIGGLIAVREISDTLAWRLIESLDVIRDRTLRILNEKEIKPADSGDKRPDPHPAVEEFLIKIRNQNN